MRAEFEFQFEFVFLSAAIVALFIDIKWLPTSQYRIWRMCVCVCVMQRDDMCAQSSSMGEPKRLSKQKSCSPMAEHNKVGQRGRVKALKGHLTRRARVKKKKWALQRCESTS